MSEEGQDIPRDAGRVRTIGETVTQEGPGLASRMWHGAKNMFNRAAAGGSTGFQLLVGGALAIFAAPIFTKGLGLLFRGVPGFDRGPMRAILGIVGFVGALFAGAGVAGASVNSEAARRERLGLGPDDPLPATAPATTPAPDAPPGMVRTGPNQFAPVPTTPDPAAATADDPPVLDRRTQVETASDAESRRPAAQTQQDEDGGGDAGGTERDQAEEPAGGRSRTYEAVGATVGSIFGASNAGAAIGREADNRSSDAQEGYDPAQRRREMRREDRERQEAERSRTSFASSIDAEARNQNSADEFNRVAPVTGEAGTGTPAPVAEAPQNDAEQRGVNLGTINVPRR